MLPLIFRFSPAFLKALALVEAMPAAPAAKPARKRKPPARRPRKAVE
ncbi:hypothetical protein GALL_116370 [mine drainage metagenome]|uniref:Uncharacterized protein n=1 Tax=mine drainage metagenome TaxID=410659 RepID=A0A1J5SQ36_9ZZZZ